MATLASIPNGSQVFRAAAWDISRQQTEAWLQEIEDRHLPDGAGRRDRQRFRRQLHLDDLMLARACALGREAAWEQLWATYQPRLRAAALRLTHNTEGARDLADTLLGDLFGLRAGGEAAPSKLLAYHGLGSLEAWLCTLLAQSHINQWRRQRHQVPLDLELEQSDRMRALLVEPNQEVATAQADCRPLETALTAALDTLTPPMRLLLSLYFLDGHTLREIALLQRVHESTISRRINGQLRRLRREVSRQLAQLGLRPAAREAVMRTAAGMDPGWLHVDVRAGLRAPRAPRNAHGA
ncbi:MAG TPA: RNA polymerase sigma factor [Terriglobales bacterium]|nr:RNA polymerase sigma factor [Terriglobales bacterium]